MKDRGPKFRSQFGFSNRKPLMITLPWKGLSPVYLKHRKYTLKHICSLVLWLLICGQQRKAPCFPLHWTEVVEIASNAMTHCWVQYISGSVCLLFTMYLGSKSSAQWIAEIFDVHEQQQIPRSNVVLGRHNKLVFKQMPEGLSKSKAQSTYK